MKNRITLFFVLLMISTSIYAQKVMRIGIIGLDTSHSTAFTELINSGSDETFSKGFRVVAAYPYGSKTIQSSYERIPGYIEKVKAQGVEITSSIADLLEKWIAYFWKRMTDGFTWSKQWRSSKPVKYAI